LDGGYPVGGGQENVQTQDSKSKPTPFLPSRDSQGLIVDGHVTGP